MSTNSTRRMVERAGWVPFACAIAALLLVGVAGLTWNTSPSWGRGNAQAIARKVGMIPMHGGTIAPTLSAYLSPHRVEIPKLNAEAPIVPVATNAQGELDVPLNPKVVGWWKPGARPGAKQGTAILAGHINYSGVTGTLAQIGTLDPGDTVLVFGKHKGRKTELRFQITGVRTYHKTNLPYRQIFNQNVPGRLALVTCGGPFDASTGNYLDNIVAFAVPVAYKQL